MTEKRCGGSRGIKWLQKKSTIRKSGKRKSQKKKKDVERKKPRNNQRRFSDNQLQHNSFCCSSCLARFEAIYKRKSPALNFRVGLKLKKIKENLFSAVFFKELVYSPLSIDKLHLSCKERMTLITNINLQRIIRRAGRKGVATGTLDMGFL